jgi:hypothetical protein
MKNSETDREWVDLIRATLDNYEEDYLPGSWENFVLKQRKRRKILLWRFGIGFAASLMLGWFGVKVYFPAERHSPIVRTYQPARSNQLSVKTHTDDSSQSNSNASKLHPNRDANVFKYVVGVPTPDKTTANIRAESSIAQDERTSIINKKTSSDQTKDTNNPAYSFKDTLAISKIANEPMPDTLKTGSVATNAVKENTPEKAPPANLLLDSLNTGQTIAATPTKRKVKFGVNFSTGVNSTQTNHSFGLSGGINTDIPLTSSFLFSTGLQIEHQKVINGNSNNQSSVASATPQTTADMVNLDLPLNITWKFLSRPSTSYYLSGGVSTLAYLSEKYESTTHTQQFTEARTMLAGAENLSYQVVDSKSTSQTSVTPFHTIDFAGKVNIIFGLEQRLSPKLYLHVEPYLKIPVSGLGTYNLKYTTSGIGCKISF